MTAPAPSRFLIVGGGLGGPLMAIFLGRAGHQVDLYERRADPRGGKGGEGRSINLAISTRGLHALERAGLRETIASIAIPMRGRMVHPAEGGLAFQPYGTRKDQAINSVSRSALNIALLDAAERLPNVRLHFERRCVGVDLDLPSATFLDPRTGESFTAAADAVVGADGAFSAVRGQMMKQEGFNFRQDYLEWGYKELSIPPAEGGGFRMEKNALHIWPRGGYMLIALPNFDGSFTATCFWPVEGPRSFAVLRTEEEVRIYFRAHFEDALPHLPTLAEDYFANPVGSLVTIRCGPWHHRDRAVLLGDACHAVVPFYGQGANASFEDCVVLDECLREFPDRAAAFAGYYARRKPHTDALADLSLENFIEMRDRTASPAFLFGKQMEKTLHHILPFWFVPLYSMVTFSRIPYAEAVRKARAQWRAVKTAGLLLAGLVLLLLLGTWTWN